MGSKSASQSAFIFHLKKRSGLLRCNVEFKMDVTHCYKGWKISRPYACTFGFAHVLNLSALDTGILLYNSNQLGRKRVALVDDDPMDE